MQAGDVIDGKYQIELQLGEGGMGRVMAASHLAIGSTVAIKLLKPEALKFPEVPQRFLREARAAGRLRSEHIVKVTDVGQLASGEPYMVMEMLHGFDLSTRLDQGPVPASLAVEYIVQACEGLAEAHALGMVHRDIKPANLFVTKRPNGAPLVKVLDFGIATAATGDIDHNLTSTLTVIGSPSYMSPEQLRAARDVCARSDIWSLGVTLYELLSGEQPFVGPTLTALTLKIVGEPHAPIPNIPPALNQILDRCLAKDRDHRFTDVAELARALAPLFPNGGVAAEMVAGSLSQPVAPTLLGLESSSVAAHAVGSGQLGSSPTMMPLGTAPAGVYAATPVPGVPITGQTPHVQSTTSLGAGQSAPKHRRTKGRGVWLALGAIAVVAVVSAGIVIATRGGGDGEVGEVQPAVAPAPPLPAPAAPTVEPIEPAVVAPPVPEPAPATTPDPVPAPEPAVVEEPIEDPTPPAKKPVKKPVKKTVLKKPVNTPRPPVVPPPVVPPAPVFTPPPVVTPPPPPPPKKPCAPNDPRCGL